jgi:hypothetical protein
VKKKWMKLVVGFNIPLKNPFTLCLSITLRVRTHAEGVEQRAGSAERFVAGSQNPPRTRGPITVQQYLELSGFKRPNLRTVTQRSRKIAVPLFGCRDSCEECYERPVRTVGACDTRASSASSTRPGGGHIRRPYQSYVSQLV